MASRLNGCYITMLEFSFEKNGKCIKLDKNRTKKKRTEKYIYGKEIANYFEEWM